MTAIQILHIVWARKWLVLALLVVVSAIGIGVTLTLPRQYTADSTMVVEMRIDPVLGAVAPSLAAPGYMATQIEIMRSERVASRVVQMLGIERSAKAVQQWQEATSGKVPIERFFAGMMQRGLTVEPVRGSNLIEVSFSSADPQFAQAAANAFVQAYLDVSVELRIAPVRQSAAFLDEQTKVVRANLEAAQAKLSKFQQEKGIVVSDERLDQENARYAALGTQLSQAQAELVQSSTQQRNSGTEMSPDVLSSPAVASLKSQLATAQTKLTEISAVVGRNHPQRIQLEAQIAELRGQLDAEIRRVSGGASTVSRGSAQKVAELKALLETQKKLLLSLRADRDQIAVYARDVDTAQRAYDAVTSRLGQFNLDSQNNQANVRMLTPAVEPLQPSRPKIRTGIVGSIAAGLVVGLLAAIGWEFLDRRVRSVNDLVIPGVPVIGMLREEGAKRPMLPRLLGANSSVATAPRALLTGPRSSA
ncbi:MAG TPA: chain length determinant protein EpsF [Burkholderiaceae bacterium]|nr:chain length determinant protein EpsF [Burkholderiaceae bacterium]